MSDNSNTPFLQRKSTLIGGGAALLLVIIVASLKEQPAPTPRPVAGAQDARTAAPAGAPGTQGLGSAGQTAEFNQTFAARLREEQSKEISRLQGDMARQLDERVKAETAALRAEVSKGNQEMIEKLDALTRAQQEAIDRRQDQGRPSLRFVRPGARRAVDGISEAAPALSSEDGGEAVSQPGAVQGKVQSVVPPNGFVNGRLLNGVVSTVGEPPTAFLVALEGQYKAANGFTVNLNGCMASVEGKPNLAAGRIEGKPAEITCNFPQEGRVKTWQVAGWVVDAEDGVRGLSAFIVDNSGRKILASTVGASLAAAGAAFTESQYTSVAGSGGVTRSLTGSVGSAMAGAMATGAGSGLSAAINEHFSLYKPTLQKAAGSGVTLVITNELPVPKQGEHITTNTNVVKP